jgi:DNA-binding beta-propeller fold protein YncE
MMRARRLTTIGLAALAAAALAASPAAAHLVRATTSFIPTGLEGPVGAAVNQATGDVYVAGSLTGNVERFSPTGVLETSFVSPELTAPKGVAVDNSSDASNGDVYVAEPRTETVVKLNSSGQEVVAGFTPITRGSIPAGDVGSERVNPFGVAVDPANGDVFVADDANAEVDIFSSSGAFVSQFHGGQYGVAVGSGSEIFTASALGLGAQGWSPVDKYETPTAIDSNDRYAIAVDRATGAVIADDPEENGGYLDEYQASSDTLLQQFGTGLFEGSFGVAVDEQTNTVYATAFNSGLVYVFGAPVAFAEVSTGTPAGVTSRAAEMRGSVNPEGTTVTECRFEFGPSAAYGSSVPCSAALPLTGNAAIPVTASLTGLLPDATYHYRLVAVAAAGAQYPGGTSYGEDQAFKTSALAPSLASESVSAVEQTSAILNAGINPNNQDTTYHFQFGPTTAYGTVLPAPDADIGSVYANVVVGQQLTGLSPGTTYHFRVVATNASSPAGGTAGPDQTFTTPPLQPPVVATGQAGGVAQNSAVLAGTIDTQGYETVYEFDIGVDTSYGTRIFGDAGAELGTQAVAAALQGLTPGTTYHYRIVATNTFGTVYGVDETFTTGTYPSAALAAPVAPALVPTMLLAPQSAGPGVAKAANVKLAASAARRHTGAGKSAAKTAKHKHRGTTGGPSHARSTNGRGK